MSVSFEILPDRGLVYVRYIGTALVSESARCFGQYAAHKDFAPGQKQLVDLSGVTGYERDYPRIFDLQMRKADVFMDGVTQTLLVYFAPTQTAMSLASLIARSWDGVPGTCPRIVDTCEEDALRLLGQPESLFAELFQTACPVRSRQQG